MALAATKRVYCGVPLGVEVGVEAPHSWSWKPLDGEWRRSAGGGAREGVEPADRTGIATTRYVQPSANADTAELMTALSQKSADKPPGNGDKTYVQGHTSLWIVARIVWLRTNRARSIARIAASRVSRHDRRRIGRHSGGSIRLAGGSRGGGIVVMSRGLFVCIHDSDTKISFNSPLDGRNQSSIASRTCLGR